VQFKSYFQLLPNQVDIAPAYFGVIRKFQWRHVHLIVQNENLFTVVSKATLLGKKCVVSIHPWHLLISEKSISSLTPSPFPDNGSAEAPLGYHQFQLH